MQLTEDQLHELARTGHGSQVEIARYIDDPSGSGASPTARLLDEIAAWDIYAPSDDVRAFVADVKANLFKVAV